MITSMLDDTRQIELVYYEPDGTIRIGHAGVTMIEVYREAGQGGYVPWFAVWEGDHLAQRVNAAQIAGVVYAKPEGT